MVRGKWWCAAPTGESKTGEEISRKVKNGSEIPVECQELKTLTFKY
jgi:hypothetical protein